MRSIAPAVHSTCKNETDTANSIQLCLLAPSTKLSSLLLHLHELWRNLILTDDFMCTLLLQLHLQLHQLLLHHLP